MILKFDDIIYQQTFTIKAKDKDIDIVVSVTDQESEELGQIINDALAGNVETDDEIVSMLFKDDVKEIKDVLVGHNFTKFLFVVMGDYANFMAASLQEALTTTKQQETTEH